MCSRTRYDRTFIYSQPFCPLFIRFNSPLRRFRSILTVINKTKELVLDSMFRSPTTDPVVSLLLLREPFTRGERDRGEIRSETSGLGDLRLTSVVTQMWNHVLSKEHTFVSRGTSVSLSTTVRRQKTRHRTIWPLSDLILGFKTTIYVLVVFIVFS